MEIVETNSESRLMEVSLLWMLRRDFRREVRVWLRLGCEGRIISEREVGNGRDVVDGGRVISWRFCRILQREVCREVGFRKITSSWRVSKWIKNNIYLQYY